MYWQGRYQDKIITIERLHGGKPSTTHSPTHLPISTETKQTDWLVIRVVSTGIPSFSMIKKWGKCSYNSDKLELFMMTLLWISISAEIEKFLYQFLLF